MRVVASVAAIMVAVLCVAPVATATTPLVQPADLEGRWRSQGEWNSPKETLTFDISACTGGWCGVVVRNDLNCGQTALRLSQRQGDPIDGDGIHFTGRAELAAGTSPYFMRGSLYRDARGLRLTMFGSTSDDFGVLRRSYPFHQLMARIGDAKCKADPKTS
jgi:hypothetical protein